MESTCGRFGFSLIITLLGSQLDSKNMNSSVTKPEGMLICPDMCPHALDVPSSRYLAYRSIRIYKKVHSPTSSSKTARPRYQPAFTFLSSCIEFLPTRSHLLITLLQRAPVCLPLALHPYHPVHESFPHLGLEADILHGNTHPLSALQRKHQPIPGYHNPRSRRRGLFIPAQTSLPTDNVAAVLASSLS